MKDILEWIVEENDGALATVIIANGICSHFRIRKIPNASKGEEYRSRVNIGGYIWAPCGKGGDIEQCKKECNTFENAILKSIKEAREDLLKNMGLSLDNLPK